MKKRKRNKIDKKWARKKWQQQKSIKIDKEKLGKIIEKKRQRLVGNRAENS